MSLLNALATVTLKNVSGFAKDDVVNTFPFQCDGSTLTSTKVSQLVTALAAFYNAAQSTTRAPAYYLSPTLSRVSNASIVRVYDVASHLDGTPHGSPVGSGTFTLGAAAASEIAFPDQLALVMTTRGTAWSTSPVEAPDGTDPGSAVDRPRQRHTGRIYLGPLNGAADVEASDGTPSRPHAAFITTLLDAAEDLQVAAHANGDNWSTWSRADHAMRNVIEVQVDNRWDTQRRRLIGPTARSIRAV